MRFSLASEQQASCQSKASTRKCRSANTELALTHPNASYSLWSGSWYGQVSETRSASRSMLCLTFCLRWVVVPLLNRSIFGPIHSAPLGLSRIQRQAVCLMCGGQLARSWCFLVLFLFFHPVHNRQMFGQSDKGVHFWGPQLLDEVPRGVAVWRSSVLSYRYKHHTVFIKDPGQSLAE